MARKKKKKTITRSSRPLGRLGQRFSPATQKNYRSPAYVETIMQAEIAVYEAFIVTDRQLTDRQVRTGLEDLMRELRMKGYAPAEAQETVEVNVDHPRDFLTWNIKAHWDGLFTRRPRFPEADLIGCLRTILDSISTWATPAADSRGYLYYLEGFMSKLGVNVQLMAEDGAAVEEEEETDESRLLELGQAWLKRDTDANWEAFSAAVGKLLEARRPEPVIHVCQYLIGATGETEVIEDLREFLRPAYRQMGVPFR